MMKNLNNKEEQFKDILQDLELDVDTTALWNELEPQLPTNKKRRFGWLFFVGLSMVLFLGVSLISFSAEKQSTHSESFDSKIDNQEIKNNQEFIPNTANNIENRKSPAIIEKSNQNVIESNQNNIESSLIKTRPGSNENIITSKASSYVNNRDRSTIKNSSSSKNSIVNESANSEYSSSLISANITRISKSTVEESNATTIVNSTKDFVNQQNEGINLIALLPSLSISNFVIVDRLMPGNDFKLIEPAFRSSRTLILGMKLGVNQNYSSVSDINSIGEFDNSEFDFERDRLGVSGSLFVGVENSNGWRFTVGASYHQYTSTYERDDVVLFTDLVSGVEYYRIDEEGTLLAQQGQSSVVRVRDNDLSWHRTHKSLDLYASVGKKLWSLGNFVWIADLGMGVNNYTAHSGYYLEDQAFGFTKIDNDDHPYRINTHWNVLASTEIAYDFGKTRLGVSPFMRWNPNSITNDNHFYKLKNSQVGIQLSLTYMPTRE